jgi:hypothetical protein
MEYIKRDFYLDQIRPFIDKPIIKVLSGQRRVGKSYIMMQLSDEICIQNKNANIIYINCEMEEYRKINNYKNLHDYVQYRIKKGSSNYLFIDEVQEIESFQNCLRSLLAEGVCDIYCTGSNAHILSGELATFLSGRFIEFEIHSLSYIEFLEFHKLENSQDNLIKYLTYGGMPFLIHLNLTPNQVFEYLKNVYSTILLKDVVEKEKIRNISFLENLVRYISNNIGSLFSANNISKYLKSQQINMTPQLVLNYLKGLTNSYIIHKVSRFEIGGLKIFEIGEKYYFEDLGIRNFLFGTSISSDIHKIMENAIYLHLIQSGFTIYVGKIGSKEIDFVAEKNGNRIYIQSALTVMEEKTKNREFGNLMDIHDNYPKFVITLNDLIIGSDYFGIKHINLAEFLLMKL